MIAPVAFFIFNRPDTTARVFERIRAAKPSKLLIVADGPRSERPEDAAKCQAARAIVARIDWPCETLTNFSEANLGCRQRMSSGLDWVFQRCEEAIILEDDCVPAPSFFPFCTEMLERYRDDTRVMHVTGGNFQNGIQRGDASYYFSRYVHVWGWASWRRAWKFYDVSMAQWPTARSRRWLEAILQSPAEVQYWTETFDAVHAGKIDTWDYQLIFSCWIQSGLAAQPNVNLISNIGAGPDATHTRGEPGSLEIPLMEIGTLTHPQALLPDVEADRYTFEHHFGGGRGAARPDLRSRLVAKIACCLRRLTKLPRTVFKGT